MRYQIWYLNKWVLASSKNKKQALRYGKRLAKVYGRGVIKLRKVPGEA